MEISFCQNDITARKKSSRWRELVRLQGSSKTEWKLWIFVATVLAVMVSG